MVKIGFKTSSTDTLPEEFKDLEGSAHLEAILRIARRIHESMEKNAKSIIRNKQFSEHSLKDMEDFLNKIYIKFYEPLE